MSKKRKVLHLYSDASGVYAKGFDGHAKHLIKTRLAFVIINPTNSRVLTEKAFEFSQMSIQDAEIFAAQIGLWYYHNLFDARQYAVHCFADHSEVLKILTGQKTKLVRTEFGTELNRLRKLIQPTAVKVTKGNKNKAHKVAREKEVD